MKAPVVFVHGAFGRALHFEGWVERFRAAGYTCVAPSLPGHDPSDPAALQTLTAAVLEWLARKAGRSGGS